MENKSEICSAILPIVVAVDSSTEEIASYLRWNPDPDPHQDGQNCRRQTIRQFLSAPCEFSKEFIIN